MKNGCLRVIAGILMLIPGVCNTWIAFLSWYLKDYKKYNKQITVNKSDTLNQAFKNARKKCSLNDNIIIYGSFFTVSETMNGVLI